MHITSRCVRKPRGPAKSGLDAFPFLDYSNAKRRCWKYLGNIWTRETYMEIWGTTCRTTMNYNDLPWATMNHTIYMYIYVYIYTYIYHRCAHRTHINISESNLYSHIVYYSIYIYISFYLYHPGNYSDFRQRSMAAIRWHHAVLVQAGWMGETPLKSGGLVEKRGGFQRGFYRGISTCL